MIDAPWTGGGESGQCHPDTGSSGRTIKTVKTTPWGCPTSRQSRWATPSEDVVTFSPHAWASLDRETTTGSSSHPGGSSRPGGRGSR